MNPLKAANPITVTKGVVGLAGTAIGLAGTVAREAVHVPVGVTKGAIDLAGAAASLAGAVAQEAAHAVWPEDDASEVADDPTIVGPTTAAAAEAAVTDVAAPPPGPTIVPAEPHAPDEPPVDVVGEALASEGEIDGAGMAHEPHGASRDEEHGQATLQRAEVEEIAAEAEAALEGDVEPEEHLMEPLVDPGDAKALAAELSTMSKAADPDKG